MGVKIYSSSLYTFAIKSKSKFLHYHPKLKHHLNIKWKFYKNYPSTEQVRKTSTNTRINRVALI